MMAVMSREMVDRLTSSSRANLGPDAMLQPAALDDHSDNLSPSPRSHGSDAWASIRRLPTARHAASSDEDDSPPRRRHSCTLLKQPWTPRSPKGPQVRADYPRCRAVARTGSFVLNSSVGWPMLLEAHVSGDHLFRRTSPRKRRRPKYLSRP